MEAVNYKELFYKLIASLTLCDHMGDVAEVIEEALRKASDFVWFDDLEDLQVELAKRGVTTLYGTSFEGEYEEEDGK